MGKKKACHVTATLEPLVLATKPQELRPVFKHAMDCLICKRKLLDLGVWPLGCVSPFQGYLRRMELEEDTPGARTKYDAHIKRCVACAVVFRKAAELSGFLSPEEPPEKE